MKTPLNRAAYRQGFNAARKRPRQCPYATGSVAADSWHRGIYEYDIGLPQLCAQTERIYRIERQLRATIMVMRAKLEASEESARHIGQESYESEERHVRKIAALNGKLREAEDREREAQQQRDFVLDTARLLERAHERRDDVEIDHLIAKLKAGW